MPRRTIVAPHWEPLCYVVKVRFTATRLHTLDQLVSGAARVACVAASHGGALRVAGAGRRPAAAAAPGPSAGDIALASYDEGSAARAAGRRLVGGRVDVAPQRADRGAATRVPRAGGRLIRYRCACTAVPRSPRSRGGGPYRRLPEACARRSASWRSVPQHDRRHGSYRAAPGDRTGARRPRGPGRPWRDASVTDAPPCPGAWSCARPHVIDRFAAVSVPDRHGVARARVNGGAARTRRRIGFLSSVSRRRLRTAPVRGVFTRTGRPLGVLRTRPVRASRFRDRRTASSLAVGSWASRARTETGACLPPKAACCARRCGWCVRDGGLPCSCRGRALDPRSGVGEWRVASVRVAGAPEPGTCRLPWSSCVCQRSFKIPPPAVIENSPTPGCKER